MGYRDLILQFSKFYPIRGKKEEEFRDFLIKNFLSDIKYEIQEFFNRVPVGRSELYVDGVLIPSYPSTFRSGKVDEKSIVTSTSVTEEYQFPNINFNPYSDDIAGIIHFVNVPAISISRKDIDKVLRADLVDGTIQMTEEGFRSGNILVGNLSNPKNIVFCHYDTVMSGASDNSSGVALLINVIRNHRDLLSDNLFVIAGSEELSYDLPTYWGYGYRVFEYEYKELMDNARKIIVVDTLGFDKPVFNDDEGNLMEAFPIRSLKKYREKVHALTAINTKMDRKNKKLFYSFYHSNSDTIDLIDEGLMKEAEKMLLKALRQ